MQQKLLFFALVILGGSLLISCKKDTIVPAPTVTSFPARVEIVFMATMNGASESTATPSTASGTAALIFNKNTKIFTIVVTYSGLTVTSAHIHKGAVGANGSIVFPLTDPLSSPINYTSPALTTDQEADLNAGLYYVNLHTVAYPGGEIRGQLIKQ